MAEASLAPSPGLASYLKSVRQAPVESSIEQLISLLKRRQIRSSRSCAIATIHLLRRVVAGFRATDINQLIERVQRVGQRVVAAQPREIAVDNIIRRVLGLIREEAEADRKGDHAGSSEADTDSRPPTPQEIHSPSFSSPDFRSNTGLGSSGEAMEPLRKAPMDISHLSDLDKGQRPSVLTSQSMFSLLSHPISAISSPISSSGTQSPALRNPLTSQALSTMTAVKDLRAEVIEGIEEIIDELSQVDEQIAAYALEHIHSNEIILTTGSSTTVQKFLLRAATKRKFTVIHAEAFPNNHEETYSAIMGPKGDGQIDQSTEAFSKPLTEAGITVILIPDAAVFALMSRVNKVILGTHVVLANGGLVAAAGAKAVAKAAKVHRTPVIVVTGVFKLSPIYPFDFDSLIEFGDSSKIFDFADGNLLEGVEAQNPLYDYVPAELVDLYITNLGGHSPSYLYRIVSDHYRVEDTNLARVD